MKERPILFSGPMVRALLDGSKTQTRRVVKPPLGYEWLDLYHGTMINRGGHKKHLSDLPRKYGQPGDRLWVRETHNIRIHPEDSADGKGIVWYHADQAWQGELRWRPSIHMPRWASRILLEIVSVRVERLQDITEADAIAEGIEKTKTGFWSLYGQRDVDGTFSPLASYQALWELINGTGSWEANPWVWVIEFKRVMP